VLGEIVQSLPNEHARGIDDIAAGIVERDLEAAGRNIRLVPAAPVIPVI